MSLPAFVSADGFRLLKSAGFTWHRGAVLFLAPHGWAGIGQYRPARGAPKVATVIKGMDCTGSQTAQVETDLVQAVLDAAHWDLRQRAKLGPRPWRCSGCTEMNAHPTTVCSCCGERRWAWKDRKGPKRAPPRAVVIPFAGDAGCTWCAGEDDVRQQVDGLRLCAVCRQTRQGLVNEGHHQPKRGEGR